MTRRARFILKDGSRPNPIFASFPSHPSSTAKQEQKGDVPLVHLFEKVHEGYVPFFFDAVTRRTQKSAGLRQIRSPERSPARWIGAQHCLAAATSIPQVMTP